MIVQRGTRANAMNCRSPGIVYVYIYMYVCKAEKCTPAPSLGPVLKRDAFYTFLMQYWHWQYRPS